MCSHLHPVHEVRAEILHRKVSYFPVNSMPIFRVIAVIFINTATRETNDIHSKRHFNY